MKFLLCALLSSYAIQAMDAKDDSAEMDCSSEQVEFDVDDFERNFDDWQEKVQGNSSSDDEEAADSSDEKEPRKKIKRARPAQQNFKRKAQIEIARQNLYRLGSIAQPAAPAVAHSFFKPEYTDGVYYLTCPVCFYKIAATLVTKKSEPARIRLQLRSHLKKSKRHPFDDTSRYKEEWLKGRVIPLYDAMVDGRNFKDLCLQGPDALLEDKGLPAENPYTLKKLKSE